MRLMVVFLTSSALISGAQEQEAQQLLLDVAKLVELKNILTDLKKGYEIIAGGYETIKDIAEGTFNLHQRFLDGLMQVSPVVKKYRRIADIISGHVALVKAYKSALKQFKRSGRFTPNELEYITGVYSGLFDQSQKNLDALLTVVTAGTLRMSDAERLDAIDRIWEEMQNQDTFLRHFNTSTNVLALQRAKEAVDIGTAKDLYGASH